MLDQSETTRLTRADGKVSIRHTICDQASALLNSCPIPLAPRLERFLKVFAELQDTRQANLLPIAVRNALSSAFRGTDLRVLDEVRFRIADGSRTGGEIVKRLDLVILSDTPVAKPRCVVVEVKATMEFNPLAAALMEFALLTEPELIELYPRNVAEPLTFERNAVRCLTVSCNDNQDIASLYPIMARQLWPDGSRSVEHHRLFLPYRGKGATAGMSDTLGVMEFIRAVEHWCLPQAGVSS
jgi:hypothetical protein